MAPTEGIDDRLLSGNLYSNKKASLFEGLFSTKLSVSHEKMISIQVGDRPESDGLEEDDDEDASFRVVNTQPNAATKQKISMS